MKRLLNLSMPPPATRQNTTDSRSSKCSFTQLNHHPPDPLPLDLSPIILPEETNIPQIPLRQHNHHGIELPRPIIIITILTPRIRDERIIAIRLREPQRLLHIRDRARSKQKFQQARFTTQDRSLDRVGVGAGFRRGAGGVDVCAFLDEEFSDGFAAHGEGDHEGGAVGGGACVHFGAGVEEDVGDGFAALGYGFLEDVEADGGGDLVFGVDGGAVSGEEGHHGVVS